MGDLDNTGEVLRYREISILDKKNPISLVNMVSTRVSERIQRLDKKYLSATEKQLRTRCQPGAVENQIRLSFWCEYEKAIEAGRPMVMENVYGPVCTMDFFYRVIVRIPSKLAWVIFPPTEYSLKMEEMLHLGLDRMRDVLNLPMYDHKGIVNTKLISEWVKIVALLDNRVKGAVVQRLRVDQSSLNMNLNAEVGPAKPAAKSVSDIERELRQVEDRIKKIEAPYKAQVIKDLNERDGSGAEVVEAAQAQSSEG